MLAASSIVRRFGDGSGLNGVSVTILTGESRVLMGPSGSGKTTLLRVLALLDVPDSGELQLDDTRIQFPSGPGTSLSWPYPDVTLVFQQLFLWPHLSNRRNLALSLRSDVQRQYLLELVEAFEMESFLDKYPNQSSLGQRQRVAIARALALQPRFLLLDEATSALDSRLSLRVASLLKAATAKGLGVLAVTHDPRFAEAVGGTPLWMEDGELAPAARSQSL